MAGKVMSHWDKAHPCALFPQPLHSHHTDYSHTLVSTPQPSLCFPHTHPCTSSPTNMMPLRHLSQSAPICTAVSWTLALSRILNNPQCLLYTLPNPPWPAQHLSCTLADLHAVLCLLHTLHATPSYLEPLWWFSQLTLVGEIGQEVASSNTWDLVNDGNKDYSNCHCYVMQLCFMTTSFTKGNSSPNYCCSELRTTCTW